MSGVDERDDEFNDKNSFLDTDNVYRIMKRNIPSHGKITKEVKDGLSECVSEFVKFITCEASDICLKDKRSKVNGNDIVNALASLGFEKYADVLSIFLEKYREVYKDDDKDVYENESVDDSSLVDPSFDNKDSNSVNNSNI